MARIVDASLQIPGASVHSRPPADQRDATLLVHVLEIDLAHIPMNEGNDPKLALHQFVEVLNQVLIPHEVGLPGLRLRFLTF